MPAIVQRDEPVILQFLSYLRLPFSLVGTMAVFVLGTSLFSICSLLKNRQLDNAIIFGWARLLCWVNGIQMQIEGEENLPFAGCILLFNHSSYFDIPIMYRSIRKHFRFGAKAELFKTPFLGMALKTMGALPIHRGKRTEVLKLYNASVSRVHKGESFALAPEGTRQSQAAIGEFKIGPFIFALQAGAPLVPVVIKGALEIMPKGTAIFNRGRWQRRVVLRILSPFSTSDVNPDDIEGLRLRVREAMVTAYEKMA